MYLADTLSRTYFSQSTSETLDEQVLQVPFSHVAQDVESINITS